MNYPRTDVIWNGHESTHWWVRSDDLEKFSPIKQVYAICFNDVGEILVCRSNSEGKWQIPGGHPENNESIEETLRRELLEEVDLKVKNIHSLGVQEVEFEKNPEHFYQARCICYVDELLPQTVDPASGETWERKFVPASEIIQIVQWGDAGDAMFADAIELWKRTHK